MTPPDAHERRVITLVCGTEARRRAARDEISELLADIDVARLVALLRRVNLLVLIGQRLLPLGLGDTPELERELDQVIGPARKWGAGTELACLQVLSRLEAVGIRALPLKGSILARQLYGDVGARSSMDIDILVDRDDLPGAVAAVEELGWAWEAEVRRQEGLPALHERLVHPSLPRVELHWRVHWYEQRFAADALARAESAADGEPLRMQPLDGLVALMLFYARDGFAGLRYPTDAAAWWDLTHSASDGPPAVDAVIERYPELAAPVRVASALLSELVGIPAAHTGDPPFRWRVAAGLATPFLEGGREQAEANRGLADLLLAPPGTAGDAMSRLVHNAPGHPAWSPEPARTSWMGVLEHLLRVARRWALAIATALMRRRAPRRLSWSVASVAQGRAQRRQSRVPLPADLRDPGDGTR